jgi:hypothetical protein
LDRESDDSDADAEFMEALEQDVQLAKTRARDAEQRLHAERVRVVDLLSEHPELQLLMDRMVPPVLLPLFRAGRTLEHYTARTAMHKPSKNTLYRATIEEGGITRQVVLKVRAIRKE